MFSKAVKEQASEARLTPSDNDNSSVGENKGHDSSYSGTTGAGSCSEDKEDSATAIPEAITKRETAAVLKLRMLVIMILVATAIAVCLVIYHVTRAGQEEEFKSQYDAAAQKIVNSFDDIVQKMSAISGLGIQYSAYSIDQGSNWPMVTMSYFQQRAGNARMLSRALYVSVSPVVMPGYVRKWEEYVNSRNNSWIAEGHEFQKSIGDFEDEENVAKSILTNQTVDPIHYFDENGYSHAVEKLGLRLPVWQTSPVLKTRIVNEDLFSRTNVSAVAKRVIFNEVAVLGRFMLSPAGNTSSSNPTTALFATLLSMKEEKAVSYSGEPFAYLYFPIFNTFNETDRATVAVMTSVIHWRSYFMNTLPSNVDGIVLVLSNTCDGSFTYELFGSRAEVKGFGDLHDQRFDKWMRSASFDVRRFKDGTSAGVEVDQEGCLYSIHVYPSSIFHGEYFTELPRIITFSIMVVFVFTTFMFLFYDPLVQSRQKIVLDRATQSTKIVSSLFPSNVRDRLMETERSTDSNYGLATKSKLEGFMNGDEQQTRSDAKSTIADLFPHCTVFFGDIAGFTAWSSAREPAQVFVLLQSLYQAFDILAKRRRVFKVETIGDCYMAVTGLPEPMDNHAIVMARFAAECIMKMHEVVRELECTLGTDTAALSLRIGLNSGAVTAGVLRGDRARFQLFGDTVNTASRMETTGRHGKIHVGESTAKYIEEAGKRHWLKLREDNVSAKGKGVMQTYWVHPASKRGSSVASEESDPLQCERNTSETEGPAILAQKNRLVEWMVDLLVEDIKKLVFIRELDSAKARSTPVVYHPPEGTICMDEVKTVIEMPEFNEKFAKCSGDFHKVEISESVVNALRNYVTVIASMYRNNPFHNFEHACHVTMSVKKLLKRIVTPNMTQEELQDVQKNGEGLASHLYNYSHGFHSDFLASLAISFAALIHDVDHQGISNIQLGKENPGLAEKYRNKSLAEQNSLDVAWDLLMMEQFDDLRCCLFPTQEELMRFRHLIVNVVLATDIFDKELNDLRKERWNKAFAKKEGDGNETEEEPAEDLDASNLRATIVIEHIIQASDVSHTMQHWHVYQKWNKRLFKETYAAFIAGRLEKDPSTFWYNGELGFFDNYILPLAKKLEECGVFGVSSDGYLNYAVQNRAEWENCGEEIVKKFIREVEAETAGHMAES